MFSFSILIRDLSENKSNSGENVIKSADLKIRYDEVGVNVYSLRI